MIKIVTSIIKGDIISKLFKFVMGAIVLTIGIKYLTSSIGGTSLSYTSVSNFMKQIGASDGDIASVNGCFLCGYLEDLFAVLGRATELFWNAIVHNLWILMAVGFGIFVVVHSVTYMRDNATSKDITDLTDAEPKFDFSKWFDKVWKTGLRVMFVGALIGAVNWSGTATLRATTNLIVTPVMYMGTTLSMAATGVISDTKCDMVSVTKSDDEILNPVLRPFMCVMGNLNSVMLAGAGGGFALMNYSWLGMGGGFFTWVAGLVLVLAFLIIGFDLLFDVLNVLFKLIFIIIFMPLLLASAAFEQVWAIAKGLLDSAINILVSAAVSILRISLKICIIYAIVYFSADSFYPGPADGFTTILPPLMGQISEETNMDAQTMSVMNAFSKCESVALVDNEMDKDLFLGCFNKQRQIIEAKYPDAFDFMDDGFEFFMFMIAICFLYFWVVSPKVDKLLGSDDSKLKFEYGNWLKDTGKVLFNAPYKIYKGIKDNMEKK